MLSVRVLQLHRQQQQMMMMIQWLLAPTMPWARRTTASEVVNKVLSVVSSQNYSKVIMLMTPLASAE